MEIVIQSSYWITARSIHLSYRSNILANLSSMRPTLIMSFVVSRSCIVHANGYVWRGTNWSYHSNRIGKWCFLLYWPFQLSLIVSRSTFISVSRCNAFQNEWYFRNKSGFIVVVFISGGLFIEMDHIARVSDWSCIVNYYWFNWIAFNIIFITRTSTRPNPGG